MARDRVALVTRAELRALARFRPFPYLVTTLYLSLDPPAPGDKAQSGALRSLVREARAALDGLDLTRKQRQSASEDLAALERVRREARSRGAAGLCALVASGADYAQVFDLPHPPKNRLSAGETPFVRPLEAALAEYPWYLVVLAGETRSRQFVVHIGRARELPELDAVSGPAGVDGASGAAGSVMAAMAGGDFDGLVLGGSPGAVATLAGELDAGLGPEVVGTIASGIDATTAEVAAACRPLVLENLSRRDAALAARLTEAMRPEVGRGVAGIAPVLGALRRGAVETLLLAAGPGPGGWECTGCGLLMAEEPAGRACPACERARWHRRADLAREMADRAIGHGAEVRHITREPAASGLRAVGGVAALLRFRLV